MHRPFRKNAGPRVPASSFRKRLRWRLPVCPNLLRQLRFTPTNTPRWIAFRTPLHAKLRKMLAKIRWGVLGAANIAVKKVVPGMQKGTRSEVTAIASRDLSRAQEA